MREVACPLCGGRFDRSAEANRCHRGCPMAERCNLVRCPHCNYEWPADSRLVAWLKRLFGVAEPAIDPAKSAPGPKEDIVEMKVRRP